MKKHKSLNNKTVEQFKLGISLRLNRDIKNIKLIGSRITGNYKKDSDLDVCILDRRINMDKIKPFIYIKLFNITCEIHYVDSFEYSYIKYYGV